MDRFAGRLGVLSERDQAEFSPAFLGIVEMYFEQI